MAVIAWMLASEPARAVWEPGVMELTNASVWRVITFSTNLQNPLAHSCEAETALYSPFSEAFRVVTMRKVSDL